MEEVGLAMSSGSKVTIREVARYAGVSISSVSRALSGHPYVSDGLRERVHQAANALGYHPDFLAHSLRSRQTRTIGFLVGTISNPVMADISASAAGVLAANGYAMTLVCSQNDPRMDVSYLRFLVHRRVDGLIVSSAANGPDQVSPVILELGVPTVMLDRDPPPGGHVSAVLSDHASGMRKAVNHLVQQGHRRIAFISGPEYFRPARERLRGFRQAMTEAGLSISAKQIRLIKIEEMASYRETLDLLSSPELPTALIAGGNLILIGVLKALRENGVAIGRDLALVGCDDIDVARIYTPSITVVARDLLNLGETTARVLIDTIEKGQAVVQTLPTYLVVRESSSYTLT